MWEWGTIILDGCSQMDARCSKWLSSKMQLTPVTLECLSKISYYVCRCQGHCTVQGGHELLTRVKLSQPFSPCWEAHHCTLQGSLQNGQSWLLDHWLWAVVLVCSQQGHEGHHLVSAGRVSIEVESRYEFSGGTQWRIKVSGVIISLLRWTLESLESQFQRYVTSEA